MNDHTLDEFLRHWVGGKYADDRMRWFRAYLTSEIKGLEAATGIRDGRDHARQAADCIQAKRQRGFDEGEFHGWGNKLKSWIEAERQRRRSEKASKAAKAKHQKKSLAATRKRTKRT